MEYLGEFLSPKNNIAKDSDRITKYFYYRPSQYDSNTDEQTQTIFTLKQLSGFPQRYDKLSEDNDYLIDQIEVSKRIDDTQNGVKRVSFVVTAIYDLQSNIRKRQSSGGGGSSSDDTQRDKYVDEDGHLVTGATKPWKMAATYSWTPISVEKPFIKGYDNNNTLNVDIVNKANRRLLCSSQRYRFQLNWSKSYNATQSMYNLTQPFINSNDHTFNCLSQTFPAGTLLILPPSYNKAWYQNRDEQEQPTTYDPYYTYNVKILYDPQGWKKKLLNVGTQANFNNQVKAEQIYCLTEVSVDNTSYTITYTNMTGVLQAKKASQTNGKTVSYQAVTQALPLTNTGAIYIAAMNDPISNPYIVLQYNQYKSMSFATFTDI